MPYQWTGYMNADGTKQMTWVGGTDTPGDAVPFQNPDANIAVQEASNAAILGAQAKSDSWNNYWGGTNDPSIGGGVSAGIYKSDNSGKAIVDAAAKGLRIRSRSDDKRDTYLYDPKTGKEYVEPVATPDKAPTSGDGSAPSWMNLKTPTQAQAAARDLTSSIGEVGKKKKWSWKAGR
jgi:hypothetical protein